MLETKKEEEGWLLIWNEIDASEFFCSQQTSQEELKQFRPSADL